MAEMPTPELPTPVPVTRHLKLVLPLHLCTVRSLYAHLTTSNNPYPKRLISFLARERKSFTALPSGRPFFFS